MPVYPFLLLTREAHLREPLSLEHFSAELTHVTVEDHICDIAHTYSPLSSSPSGSNSPQTVPTAQPSTHSPQSATKAAMSIRTLPKVPSACIT